MNRVRFVALAPILLSLLVASAADGCNSDGTTAATPDAGSDVTADVTADTSKPESGGGEGGQPDGGSGDAGDGGATLASVNHFVVIYMENHSFDNLYGEFPGADGLAVATSPTQNDGLDGGAYATLPLPLIADGSVEPGFTGATLSNAPFAIDDYVAADAATRDLHHIFFTEQFQINGGKMDQFVHWSDARGLSMGHYRTMNLPVPNEAKNWTVCDHFHHAAFGGSFLNHQFLIAAQAPVWDTSAKPLPPEASAVDDPTKINPGAGEGFLWTDTSTSTPYLVNTSFSVNSPHPYFSPAADELVPSLKAATIGDRLTAASLDWAWYAGGWNDAMAYSNDAGVGDAGGTPIEENFQYHHQPFVYYANYADGQPGRSHLKDESDFLAAAQAGSLPAVSFVKPVGLENEHPGYTDLLDGDQHLLMLIQAVKASPNWKDTAIIVTYDEHGGFWDHVAPPAGDKWGPGSRVPTIVISPFAKKGYVDHTQYTTLSILATIEKRFGLQPLTARDQSATAMMAAFAFSQ
jgi:phospholipase C